MNENSEIFSIRIKKEISQVLYKLSRKTGLSLSAVIRNLIIVGLENWNIEDNEKLKEYLECAKKRQKMDEFDFIIKTKLRESCEVNNVRKLLNLMRNQYCNREDIKEMATKLKERIHYVYGENSRQYREVTEWLNAEFVKDKQKGDIM